jgi:hypothetical protein
MRLHNLLICLIDPLVPYASSLCCSLIYFSYRSSRIIISLLYLTRLAFLAFLTLNVAARVFSSTKSLFPCS